VSLQLSDDDGDMNSSDVDEMSESDYQISSYLQHANGFVNQQMPSDWHVGRNNHTSPVETSGSHDMMITPQVYWLLEYLIRYRILITIF